MRTVTRKRCEKIAAAVKAGMTINEACKKFKVSDNTYRRFTAVPKDAPRAITINMPDSDRLTFISGRTADVMRLVESLQ